MAKYKRFTDGLYKFNKAIGTVEIVIASIIMAVVTFVMFYQVVTRYWLQIPATWVEEFCRYMFIWASFLGSAYAVLYSDHIEIDLIDTVIESKIKNPEKFKKYMKKVIYAVILIFAIYFLYVYMGYFNQIATLGQKSAAMKINMLVPLSSGVVGLALIVFHSLSLLIMPFEEDKEEEVKAE